MRAGRITSAGTTIDLEPECPIEWEWPGQIMADVAGHADVTLRITLDTFPDRSVPAASAAPVRVRHQGGGVFPVDVWPGEPRISRWVDGPWVLRDGRVFTVFAKDARSAQRWGNRALRELVLHRARAAGYRLVHAAAVTRGGRGALFMGPAGAGKTDAALTLGRHGWALLSVDRCLVRSDGTRAAVGFMPYGFNVTRRTLERLGIPDHALTDRLESWRFTKHKVYLTVAAAQEFGFQVRASGEVDRIIQLGPAPVEHEEPLGTALTDWMGAAGPSAPRPLRLPTVRLPHRARGPSGAARSIGMRP